MNSTPKQLFLSTATFVSEHNRLTERNEFQRAINFASMQYTDDQVKGDDPNGFYRLQGMREFIKVLQNLHIEPPALPAYKASNLQQNK